MLTGIPDQKVKQNSPEQKLQKMLEALAADFLHKLSLQNDIEVDVEVDVGVGIGVGVDSCDDADTDGNAKMSTSLEGN